MLLPLVPSSWGGAGIGSPPSVPPKGGGVGFMGLISLMGLIGLISLMGEPFSPSLWEGLGVGL